MARTTQTPKKTTGSRSVRARLRLPTRSERSPQILRDKPTPVSLSHHTPAPHADSASRREILPGMTGFVKILDHYLIIHSDLCWDPTIVVFWLWQRQRFN